MTIVGWFSSNRNMVLWCKEAASLWGFIKMGGSESSFLFTLVIKKAFLLIFTCILSLGGASVGTIVGAIKGQTTETGFLHGAAIGAVSGTITAVHLIELMVHGDPFSKVALFFSLMNGKFFMECVTVVLQKACQWEMSNLEGSFGEYSYILEINGTKGLSMDSIKKLPQYKYGSSQTVRPSQLITCIICLEEFKKGDITRILPSCGHTFHLQCIDEWLSQHGSCPICRKDVGRMYDAAYHW